MDALLRLVTRIALTLSAFFCGGYDFYYFTRVLVVWGILCAKFFGLGVFGFFRNFAGRFAYMYAIIG